MWYYWSSIIFFSFPFFPEFHRVVPLLQICSISEFVYDHACFWEKTCSFCVSEPGLLQLTWCPPIPSIYLQTTCHYSLWLSNTPLCIYTTISWSIHQMQGSWVVTKA
jgi:hypothetical protein